MNNAQNLKPRIGLSSGNGSASQIAGESLSINAEQSGVSVPAVDKKHSSSLTRRATGPRTQVGKQRSKYNATKHAIFSSVALLEGESRSEFNSLLEGLLENFQPIGALEEILVNKLVTLFWRYRRLLIAEAAEIRKGIAFPRTNKDDQSSQRINFVVTYVGRGEEDCELMQRIAAPEIREKCLGLLRDLKTGIEGGGFDINRDSAILTRLYGKCVTKNEKGTLFERYRMSLSAADCSEEERQKNKSASPGQCKRSFLEKLEEEIKRLDRDKSVESERMRLEQLRQYVPDSAQPDRLLRYEASLERNIDRTLNQLERSQRIRLGQSVPPPIKVDIS